MDDIRNLLTIPAGERAGALEKWLTEQPDADRAADLLASALAAMETAPHGPGGLGADTELVFFLDAERLRFPLDSAAEQSSKPAVASALWTHAAVSALVTGELADLPYCYARQAVVADPASERAWATFAESIESYPTDLFDDLETWIHRARAGSLPEDFPARVLAAARSVASSWDEDDRARLDAIAGSITPAARA